MSAPWLDKEPDLWNTVVLGSEVLPGICKVAVNLSHKIDVKEPTGKHGASTTLQGLSPAKITIYVKLWGPAQLEKWSAVVAKIRPRNKDSENLQIIHPKTDLYGIRAVIVESIKDPANERGDIYEFTIECVEFFPVKKNSNATKTPKTLDPRKQILAKDLPVRPVKPSVDNVFAE